MRLPPIPPADLSPDVRDLHGTLVVTGAAGSVGSTLGDGISLSTSLKSLSLAGPCGRAASVIWRLVLLGMRCSS